MHVFAAMRRLTARCERCTFRLRVISSFRFDRSRTSPRVSQAGMPITLARLMAEAFDAEFIALSAVFSGVKDIREAIQKAELALQQHGRHTILFVDEVHRFNKA